MGISFIPSFLSCSNEDYLNLNGFKGKIVIIGAGISGLYGGSVLKRSKVDFEILESSNRVGGRILTDNSFASYPVELGADFIYGENNPLFQSISKNLTKVNPLDFKHTAFLNNLSNSFPNSYKESFYKVRDLNFSYNEDLLTRIQNNTFGTQQVSTSVYRSNIKSNFLNIYTYDLLTDASLISDIQWVPNIVANSNVDSMYKLNSSFDQLLIEPLKNQIGDKIKLNEEVIRIEKNKVFKIFTRSGYSTEADIVICTIPISVIRNSGIFNSFLNQNLIDQLNNIQTSVGKKILFKFNNKFFNGSIAGIKGVHLLRDVSNNNLGFNEYILSGNLYGNALIDSESTGNSVDFILNDLEKYFPNQVRNSFMDAKIYDWSSDNNIGQIGAYPNSQATLSLPDIINQGAEKNLHFAGDSFAPRGFIGTLGGATLSMDKVLTKIFPLLFFLFTFYNSYSIDREIGLSYSSVFKTNEINNARQGNRFDMFSDPSDVNRFNIDLSIKIKNDFRSLSTRFIFYNYQVIRINSFLFKERQNSLLVGYGFEIKYIFNQKFFLNLDLSAGTGLTILSNDFENPKNCTSLESYFGVGNSIISGGVVLGAINIDRDNLNYLNYYLGIKFQVFIRK